MGRNQIAVQFLQHRQVTGVGGETPHADAEQERGEVRIVAHLAADRQVDRRRPGRRDHPLQRAQDRRVPRTVIGRHALVAAVDPQQILDEAEGDFPGRQFLDDPAVDAVLLLLGGQGGAHQERELGAVEADPLGLEVAGQGDFASKRSSSASAKYLKCGSRRARATRVGKAWW